MTRKTICLTFLIALFLLDTVFFFLLWCGRVCPASLRAKNLGVPIVTHEQVPSNYMIIKQMLASDDTLYILYENHCVVSAYSYEGDYLYSISAYSHNNGAAQIAVVDSKLYLLDKYRNLYVFRNDKLLDYIEASNAEAILKKVDFNEASELFYLDGCHVFTQGPNGQPELVIKRPWYLVFTQQHIFQIILFILHGIVILLLCAKDRLTIK